MTDLDHSAAPVPRTMHAVMLRGHGGFDQLQYREDVPVPAPAAGEVLIHVGAAGVNNTDINTRTAWYSRAVTEGTTASAAAAGHAGANPDDPGWSGNPFHFPRIQGADACGRIVAVGPDVPARRIGERVIVEPVFRVPGLADAVYFGSERDGAFAQFTCVPSAHAHLINSPLSDTELASFPCAYSAAENMLTRAAVSARDRVLVTGASGGVGSAAVQLAHARGAAVLAVAAAGKAASLVALGVEGVLPREADLAAALGHDSVDVVIDVAGGSRFPCLLQILRRGGRYAVAGAIAGPVVELDLRTLYLKDLRMYGCTVLDAPVFPALVRQIESGRIKPLIAGVFALRDIVAAQQQFLTKQHVGKIVLLPDA
jgi:NADPH:quinone reductase-like Zn-dependent oxidoreductase